MTDQSLRMYQRASIADWMFSREHRNDCPCDDWSENIDKLRAICDDLASRQEPLGVDFGDTSKTSEE